MARAVTINPALPRELSQGPDAGAAQSVSPSELLNANTTPLGLSALASIRWCAASKTYYDRKRAEGKRHTQAVIALARRRLNVLWAMLRDNAQYHAEPAASAA